MDCTVLAQKPATEIHAATAIDVNRDANDFHGGKKVPPSKVFSKGCSLPRRNFSVGHEATEVTKRFKLENVKDKDYWVKVPGYLDIFVFGPTSGRCPYCGVDKL